MIFMLALLMGKFDMFIFFDKKRKRKVNEIAYYHRLTGIARWR